MPVTEIAILVPKQPYTLESDVVAGPLQRGATAQAAFSSYPVYLFTDASDKSTIYLISGWKDVAHHMEWVHSRENQEVMRGLIEHLSVESLVHPAIDFRDFPMGVRMATIEKYGSGFGKRSEADGGSSHLAPTWVESGSDEKNEQYRISVFENEEEGVFATITAQSGVTLLRREKVFGVNAI